MDTRKIINIFNEFDISSTKDESKYKISKLESITNLNHKVEVDDKKYIIRIPGDNPDLINRSSEGVNQELVKNIGITLPIILFEKDTGIKISEFYEDLYTFTSSDLKNKEFRDDALDLLNRLHNSDLKFQENFSPLNVFKTLAKNNEKIENESKAIGEEIIKRLIEIGLESKPCHQDLYHANFVYLKEKAYLIDGEYSSQGDPIFDYAELLWQNELEEDQDSINDIYKMLDIEDEKIKDKFELFQVLSMITWGFWAKRKSPQGNKGEEVLLLAIKRYENNFS